MAAVPDIVALWRALDNLPALPPINVVETNVQIHLTRCKLCMQCADSKVDLRVFGVNKTTWWREVVEVFVWLVPRGALFCHRCCGMVDVAPWYFSGFCANSLEFACESGKYRTLLTLRVGESIAEIEWATYESTSYFRILHTHFAMSIWDLDRIRSGDVVLPQIKEILRGTALLHNDHRLECMITDYLFPKPLPKITDK